MATCGRALSCLDAAGGAMSVEFGATYTKRYSLWVAWLTFLEDRNASAQYDDTLPDYYLIYFYDGPEVHWCRIWKGEVPPDIAASEGYSQAQNDADKAAFLARAPTWNEAIVVRGPDGRVRVASEKTTLSRVTAISHNWCDPTTWYSTSAYVPLEVAVATVPLTVYQLAHTNVIDSYHGKITGETYLKDAGGRSYRVEVFVNGIQKTEQDPHFGVGGDYTINYALGRITFLALLSLGDVVTVNYHYMVDSRYDLRPNPGTTLRIEWAEVQLSLDVAINDSIFFQPFGLVEIFAPQLMGPPSNLPAGTKIPLGDPVIYKTITDLISDASRSYPQYPAFGGPSWRGMQQPTLVLDWDYQGATELDSALGLEIRVWLEHHTKCGGTYVTATFYCLSEPL